MHGKKYKPLWWIYDSLVLWFLAYVDHYTSAYTIQCNLGLPKGKRSTNLWGRTVADNLKPDEKKISQWILDFISMSGKIKEKEL